MHYDVSVVVPVYNTGELIEPCIDSLLGQTLSSERYEMVFVDDGSTDQTPRRLDQLAAEHPNVQVIHEPNSGWSGRPRNVGIDAARGDYVFFCDHDDWLELDALEKLTRFAYRNSSDIVLAKMVGHRRSVPTDLFDATLDSTTPWTSPLMTSLTPHKLFRREFLNAHGLRFPEGKRRLEDHVFVVAAYLLAEKISVLADGLYYHHIRREDVGNAAFSPLEPVSYYGYVRETLDVIDKYVEPGPRRDALLRRPYHQEMLERVRGRRLSRVPEHDRLLMFSEVRKLILERFPPDFENGSAAVTRVIGAAVRAGLPDVVADVDARSRSLSAHAGLTSFDWREHGWQAHVSAEVLFPDGSPVVLEPAGDGEWMIDPRLIPAELQAKPESTEQLLQASLRVTLVNRATDEEWRVHGQVSPELQEVTDQPGAFRLVVKGVFALDPGSTAGGSPLPDGIWDAYVRLRCFGTMLRTRLGHGSVSPEQFIRPAIVGARPATVIPFFSKGYANFSVDVGQTNHSLLVGLLAPAPAAATPSVGAQVPVSIDVEPGAAPRRLRLSLQAAGREVGQCAGSIIGASGGARVAFGSATLTGQHHGRVPRGQYTISTRIRKRDKPSIVGTVRVNVSGRVVSADFSASARSRVTPLSRTYRLQLRALSMLPPSLASRIAGS